MAVVHVRVCFTVPPPTLAVIVKDPTPVAVTAAVEVLSLATVLESDQVTHELSIGVLPM